MKNKKSLLSLVLFALVLILGVGYAVVSNVGLTITGTANVKDTELKVDIASVSDDKTGNATITHSLGATHAATDTFTITGMELNNEVIMTYTIDNHEEDINATLEQVSIANNNEEHFEVTSEINGEEIAADGGTTTVTVTVKLIKTPLVEAKEEAEITVTLEAAPSGNATN